LINKGKVLGLLNLLVPLGPNADFLVLQYVDDTLIILEGWPRQVHFLKLVINTFSKATGLKVNFQKSMMLPVNLIEEKIDLLARTFGCSKGTLPFTYLGLTKQVQDFLLLVTRCERRLSSISSFLNQAGRLELTNAVFTSLPTFFMCSLELPKTIIKQIDKFRKHCLWRGADINAKKPPKAAWEMVCKPKEEGGLGVII